MSETYSVTFKGEIDPDYTVEEVRENLVKMFRATPDKIEPYFHGKVLSKKGLSKEHAERLRGQLKNIGCVCHIISDDLASEAVVVNNPPTQTSALVPFEEVKNENNENKYNENDETAEESKQNINRHLLNVIVRFIWLITIGWIIVLGGAAVGALLDITLPKNYMLGGKIAVRSFNFGTLAWFEGVDFQISMNVNAQGKGIALKEEKE